MFYPKITLVEKIQGDLNYSMVAFDGLVNNIKISSNWWDIVLFRLKFIKSAKIRLRNGKVIPVSNLKQYDKMLVDYSFNEKIRQNPNLTVNNNTIEVNGLKFGYSKNPKSEYLDTVGILDEVFVKEIYSFLNVKDRVVLSIGANIGDTAAYFATKGAKRVYSVEPYPYSFSRLLKTIKDNNLEGRVIPINAGIGDGNGFIKIDNRYKSRVTDDLKSSESGKSVPIVSLDTLIKKYAIKDAVLKLDCEGSEYSAILNSSSRTLRTFSQMQIEYHYGYRSIVDYLKKCGFSVRYTTPYYHYNIRASNKNMYIGYIYAERLPKAQ